MNSFFQAFVVADTFGKLIFLALFALSLICWSFLLYKIWIFRYVKRQGVLFQKTIQKSSSHLLQLSISSPNQGAFAPLPQPYLTLYLNLREKTLSLLQKNDLSQKQKESSNPTYLSRSDIEMLDSHLRATITKQQDHLAENLFLFSIIEKLAPFLGLLGTVWGILITFAELKLGQAGNLSNQIVLGGLSTALTTTVLGLLIAIPALISLHWMKNLLRKISVDLYGFGHFLLSTIELQYRKVDSHIREP